MSTLLDTEKAFDESQQSFVIQTHQTRDASELSLIKDFSKQPLANIMFCSERLMRFKMNKKAVMHTIFTSV